MKLTNGIHHIPPVHAETDEKPASDANPTIRSSATTTPETTTIPRNPSRQQGVHPLQQSFMSEAKAREAERKAASSPNQKGGQHAVLANTAVEAATAAGASMVTTVVTKYLPLKGCLRSKLWSHFLGAVAGAATSINIKSSLQGMQHPADKVPKEIHTDPINCAGTLLVSAVAQRFRPLHSLQEMQTLRGLMANTGVGMAGGAAGGLTNALIHKKNRTTQALEQNASLTPETDNPPTKIQLMAGSLNSKIPELTVKKFMTASSTASLPVPSRVKDGLNLAKMAGSFVKDPLTPRTRNPNFQRKKLSSSL